MLKSLNFVFMVGITTLIFAGFIVGWLFGDTIINWFKETFKTKQDVKDWFNHNIYWFVPAVSSLFFSGLSYWKGRKHGKNKIKKLMGNK